MKVVVLGAGVIGVTSAHYLARAGHEVIVLDRRAGPALETSFANAGEISPGYASPWAAPGVPIKALKWLLTRDAPLVIRPAPDPRMWLWMLSMLRNCTAARYAANKKRMVYLAEYSRDCLKELRTQTAIRYDEAALGTLQLFRSDKQLADAARDVEVLRQYNVPHAILDPDGCVAAEPGLAATRDQIKGGLQLLGDETGDCYIFTRELAKLAASEGVDFRYGSNIIGASVAGDRIRVVKTEREQISADAFVLALGSYSPIFARLIGVSTDVYPVKGYSITVPVSDPDLAPRSTIMDETVKVAITRLGNRIRVGGTAEISGYDTRLREERREILLRTLERLFPAAGDVSAPEFWTGLRPMTPSGVPIIGKLKHRNLFFNTGHGTLGWTMACGSGRMIADMISGKRPNVDLRPDG